jgi:hypothetical protein
MNEVERWCVRSGARGVIRCRGVSRLAWRGVLRAGIVLFRMRTGTWGGPIW